MLHLGVGKLYQSLERCEHSVAAWVPLRNLMSHVVGVVNPIRSITILVVRTFIKIMFPGTKISPQVSFYESEIHIESLINTKWLITQKPVHNYTIFLCSLDVGNIDGQSRGPSIKEKVI